MGLTKNGLKSNTEFLLYTLNISLVQRLETRAGAAHYYSQTRSTVLERFKGITLFKIMTSMKSPRPKVHRKFIPMPFTHSFEESTTILVICCDYKSCIL